MSSIPEPTVAATAARIADRTPDAARTALEQATQQQPALLAYLLAAIEEERLPVQAVALQLYGAVLEIFGAGAQRLPEVGIEAVERRAERIDAALERLDAAPEGFVERAAAQARGPQPHVLRYVVEALRARAEDGDDDENDDEALGDDEAGYVFLLLEAAIDLLDEAAAA